MQVLPYNNKTRPTARFLFVIPKRNLQSATVRYSPPRAAERVGKVRKIPFFTKCLKRKWTPLCLIIDIHIIADIEATGVSSEPILEPIIVANIASVRLSPVISESMPTKNILIGRLFIRLLDAADNAPKVQREYSLSNTAAILPVIPLFISDNTTTNIESRKGTRGHGIRFAVFARG